MDGLPLVDLTKHPHPALSEHPILSSERSGWRGVFFNYYDHPAHESPEFQYTQHIIGITGSGHPIPSEHRFDGQVQTRYCQPGEVLFIPAEVRYSSTWQQAGDFSVIGFFPKFFEQINSPRRKIRFTENSFRAIPVTTFIVKARSLPIIKFKKFLKPLAIVFLMGVNI